LRYVESLPKNGPLFPNITLDRFGKRGGNGSKTLGRWVREKVGITDPRIQPNHAWRHRFDCAAEFIAPCPCKRGKPGHPSLMGLVLTPSLCRHCPGLAVGVGTLVFLWIVLRLEHDKLGRVGRDVHVLISVTEMERATMR
jgi:hypothetical protein